MFGLACGPAWIPQQAALPGSGAARAAPVCGHGQGMFLSSSGTGNCCKPDPGRGLLADSSEELQKWPSCFLVELWCICFRGNKLQSGNGLISCFRALLSSLLTQGAKKKEVIRIEPSSAYLTVCIYILDLYVCCFPLFSDYAKRLSYWSLFLWWVVQCPANT